MARQLLTREKHNDNYLFFIVFAYYNYYHVRSTTSEASYMISC